MCNCLKVDVNDQFHKIMSNCCVPVGKLMELHGEGTGATTGKAATSEGGEKVDRIDGYEPPVLQSV